MERFAILPLGVGDFFSRRHFNTSFLLMLGDRVLAVDCPAPYRKMLAAAGAKTGLPLDYGQVGEVLLTHLHGDHCNGLEELLLHRHYVQGLRTRIITTAEVEADLWEHKLSASLAWKAGENWTGEKAFGPSTFYDVSRIAFGETFEWHGARFEIRRTRHPLPTFGFRCHFGGKSFGYSCDTAFDRDYIEWLAETDLVIHECNHGPHTPIESLLTLSDEIRRKMRLVHVSEGYDLSTTLIPVLEEGVPIVLIP